MYFTEAFKTKPLVITGGTGSRVLLHNNANSDNHGKWHTFTRQNLNFSDIEYNTGETVEFKVSEDKIEAFYMIPGWTHNIINLFDTEDLVSTISRNKVFDPNRPGTFFKPV